MNENDKSNKHLKKEDIKCVDIEKEVGLDLSTFAVPVKNPVIIDGPELFKLFYKNCKDIIDDNKSDNLSQIDRTKAENNTNNNIYEDIGGSTLAVPISYPIILDGIGLQECLANNSEHREIRIKVIKSRADKINKQISK